MTFEDFVLFITPLAMHFGAVKDQPTWRLYHAALMADPEPSTALLERALLRSANRRFFPSTEEFRADAETERQALLARHPFERCAECLDHCGWAPVIVDGVERMQRCSCWDRYLRRMATMGVGTQPLLLVAARQESFS